MKKDGTNKDILNFINELGEKKYHVRLRPENFNEELKEIVFALNNLAEKLQLIEEPNDFIKHGANTGSWDWRLNANKFVYDYLWFEKLCLKFEESEYLFLPWEILIHPEDKPRVLEAISHCLEDKNDTLEIVYRLKHHAGHWLWVLTKGKISERDSDGKPLRFTGSNIEITELKESDVEKQSVFSAMSIGLVIQDYEGKIINFNSSALKILGLTEDQLLGRTSMDPDWRSMKEDRSPFFGEDHPAMVALKTGEAVHNVIMGIIMPQGEERWLSINANPYESAYGRRVVATFVDITEEKKLKIRNQDILDAINRTAIIAYTDTKGKILEINENFLKISGYSRNELIGADHRLINSGIHSKKFFKDMWETIKRGEVWSGVITNRNKNGENYYLKTVITPMHNYKGEIEQYLAIRFDISEQKSIETQLVEAQSIAKVGSWQFNFNTNAQVWSDEHYKIFEIENSQPQDKLYKLYREKIHPEDLKRLDLIMERAAIFGEDFVYDHRVVLDEGKRIKYVRGIGKVFKDKLGKVISISGTCQDLTDIFKLQNQLKESLEKAQIFEAVIENSIDFIGIANAQNIPIYCNPAGRKMIGIDPDQDISKVSIPDCYPEDFKDKVLNEILREMQEKGSWSGETRFRHFKTNKEFPVSDQHFMIKKSVTGEILGHATITRDLTKVKEIEEEIRRKQQELELERAKSFQSAKLASIGEVSAGIAHEINNPLSVIVGTAEILKVLAGDNDKISAKSDLLLKSAMRIDKIVKGLKKFSRYHQSSNYEVTRLNKIIEESQIIYNAKLASSGAKIYYDLVDDLELNCDAIEIEQVIINLVNNAVDAIKNLNEKWIKIQTFSEKNEVVLRVMDSGNGISVELENKFFQPFFTTKPVGEGTGLGLSVSKKIIEDHGGRIFINRNFENTCFEIVFKKVD